MTAAVVLSRRVFSGADDTQPLNYAERDYRSDHGHEGEFLVYASGESLQTALRVLKRKGTEFAELMEYMCVSFRDQADAELMFQVMSVFDKLDVWILGYDHCLPTLDHSAVYGLPERVIETTRPPVDG
jgi:hypothetical protein